MSSFLTKHNNVLAVSMYYGLLMLHLIIVSHACCQKMKKQEYVLKHCQSSLQCWVSVVCRLFVPSAFWITPSQTRRKSHLVRSSFLRNKSAGSLVCTAFHFCCNWNYCLKGNERQVVVSTFTSVPFPSPVVCTYCCMSRTRPFSHEVATVEYQTRWLRPWDIMRIL